MASVIAYVPTVATYINFYGSTDATDNNFGRCSASTIRSSTTVSKRLDAPCFWQRRNSIFDDIGCISCVAYGFCNSWL